MWKKKKDTPKEPLVDDTESRDDFLAGPGKKIVCVVIGLTEPPSVTFELWAHKKEQRASGSYFVCMCGTVKYAEKTILEGKRCEISINLNGGSSGDETFQKGYIGFAGLRMGFLDVKIDTKSDYARDLVGLINLHGLANGRHMQIRMDLVYPRSLSLDDVDSFEVVRFFVGYPNGNS